MDTEIEKQIINEMEALINKYLERCDSLDEYSDEDQSVSKFVSFTLNHLPHPQLALTSFSSRCFLTPVCHLLLSVSHPQVKKAYDFS